MSQKLSLLDDSSDSDIELTVNKDYANKYDKWRESEELQKYKDLMKDEEDSESSSESEEIEDEFDEEFFRALSLLKSKDPRLYDKNFQLFKEKQLMRKPKAEKQKPIYMKDYERNLVLERGGKFSDEDEEPENVTTYSEEQENLKKSFKEAVGNIDDSESDVDDLLQVKTKTKKQEEEEESDYVKWLKGEEKEISEDAKKDMSYLRNYWNDPTLDEGEKFLRDYILNKRYLEKDDSIIPSYEEITSGMLSDDEKMIEEQEKFEHKYNFRFEEPDEEFIKRYPRTISDSLRRVDTRRKEKREEKAERKRKEREQRREELKRLKALKKKEIEEKFLKLKEISGQDEINLKESDIESDFDPDKHDQRMNEMFNDDYYQVEEEQKPEFPYDEELDSENWNAWTGEKIIEEDEENRDLNDKNENSNNGKESVINPKDEFANEMINASRPKKKGKKKSLFAKIISQPKPVYDPDGKSFEEYLDEYYKLDYEDVIGDMPVRYKYRKVVPNDFGLTVDEILAADDRELNRWCSVKKTCQYRNDDEELYDVQAFQKKAQIPSIKQKCLPSVYAPKDDDNSNISSFKSSKKINNLVNDNVEISEKNEVESAGRVGSLELENESKVASQDFKETLNVKKSKNKLKKKKQKLLIPEKDESTNFTQNFCTEQNDSNVELSLCINDSDEQNNVQFQEQMKKFKKKKHNEKQNIPDIDTEVERRDSLVSETTNKHSAVESPVSTEASHKAGKKKRKHSNNFSVTSDFSDIHNNIVSENLSPESKQRRLSDSNEATNCSSNTFNEASTSKNPSNGPRKKKKKKKNKHKENSNKCEIQQNQSNQFKSQDKNKSKDKNKKWASEDKRLGLSDERLAAYGINPKKFKNKIIYSKKQ